MRGLSAGLARRSLALLLCAILGTGGCVLPDAPEPRPGLPEFERLGVVAVPGGLYDVPARNLMLRRHDVSVDTRVRADLGVEAVWNSATRRWHWAHDARYDGSRFVDPLGTEYDLSRLADGQAVPGSHWVRLDGQRVKTKGGLVLGFDGQGLLADVYWLSDPYPRLVHLRSASRLELRECPDAGVPATRCRRVYSLELGPSGPVRVVDEESARAGDAREAHYAWSGGRLASAKTPFEVARGLPGTRYEYASGGLVTAQTSSEGERVEYDWLFGWLWRVRRVGEGDPSHRFSFPAAGPGDPPVYAVVHTNPLGGRTRYRFSGGGHVLSIERLDAGEAMSVDWDPGRNRPTRIVGFDGSVRRLEAWSDDEPGRVIEPSGNVLTFAYEPDGVDREQPLRRPLRSVADSLGPLLEVEYDAAGRPERWRNGEGEETRAAHLGGQVASVLTPWGASADLSSYGVHGHWRTAVLSAAPELPVHRRFDRVGNLRVPAAGLQPGGLLQRDHDPDRRLAGLALAGADSGGALTTTDAIAVERRSDGQPLAIRRPRGADHELEYDALGRLTRLRERVDGAWVETRYEYDPAGHPTRIVQPNGTSEELDRDLYGRTLERRVLRDGALEARARFERSQGRLDRWYDSARDQWESFAYDAAGRPERIVYSALGESIDLEYDLRSRVTRKTFALGSLVRVLETEWDLANRRARVSTRDARGGERDLVRPEYVGGRLAAIEYGNGLRREHRFGAEGRFEGFRTTQLASGARVEDTTFERRRAFGPSRLEVVSRSETALATTEEVYGSSPGGSLQSPEGLMGARVFRWQARSWVGGALQDEDARVYAWDERSNPVDDGEGDTFVYNAERNRLLQATVGGLSHSYAYDASGFATRRDGLELAWSATGRLARLGPAASPLVRVEWDLAGRPVRVEALGEVRELALFGGRVEWDPTTRAVGWLHLAHVSLPFAGDERRYRHLDPLGNVGIVTDEQGRVTSHRRYHPFGLDRVYGADTPDGGHHAGFAGGTELRANGATTGLVLLGARVLDAGLGRFLSQDPVLQLVSQYSYALGNPVQYEDADGRHASAKAEVAAARLEARAAQVDLMAAEIRAAASDASLKAAVLAVASALSGNLVVGVLAAAVFAAAAGFSKRADALRVQSAELRALAATLRAAQAAERTGRSPLPARPGKRLDVFIEGTRSPHLQLGVPLAPPAPSVCGPAAAGGSPWRLPVALALLAWLGSARTARRRPA